MFEHILIPTDGSELAEKAARQGVALAARIGARVTAFHAVPRFHTSGVIMALLEANRDDYEKAAKAYAERYLENVTRAAAEAGIACDSVWTTSDDPADAILAAAAERDCDLIVMGSHGRRGLQAVLLGSQTQRVLTLGRLPVLVCR